MFEIIGEINFSSLLESFVHKIDESTLFNVFFGFVAVALTRRILSLLLNLLLTLLQKLVNNIFFLKIFVINLSEDKIVNVEWTLVVVGDVTDEFKGFVGHVTGFFGEVACFYLVDYFNNISIIFSTILFLNNQIWNILEYEEILVDNTLLFHSTYKFL